MQVIVCCSERERDELLLGDVLTNISLDFIENLSERKTIPKAGAVIDLLFEKNDNRIKNLKTMADLVIINSVADSLQEIDPDFIRINAWPGFLKAPITEACLLKQSLQQKTTDLFMQLGKEIKWLPDEPGFISARVVSMIINEAYFALAEGVSTKKDIDLAMKLGTAYPHGPFEWAELIGLPKIAHLLTKLGSEELRYTPAPLLLQEAGYN